MYDLLSYDRSEMGLPDKFHDLQPSLLSETCLPATKEFFIGIDLNLYYDVDHTGWYKRPDWFLVLGRSDSAVQSGILVPTEQEGKLQSKQEVEEAKQEAEEVKREAEEAKQRANLLAAKLRELGIDPENSLI